jgi:hypothetical protein
MRKSYWFFIAFIVIMLSLELAFHPNEVLASTDATSIESVEQTSQAAIITSPNEFRELVVHESDATALDEIQTKPDTLTWKMLGVIKYVKKPHAEYPEGVMFPIVSAQVKSFAKKRVIISGFIIPVDATTYALSKNVFASCFFCGQAGPETITGIKFRGATPRLKTDQFVMLEGTFRYNDRDVEDWIYHMDDAVIVKGAKK